MDWNMPMLSGYDALKNIRAAGKKVPIIMGDDPRPKKAGSWKH